MKNLSRLIYLLHATGEIKTSIISISLPMPIWHAVKFPSSNLVLLEWQTIDSYTIESSSLWRRLISKQIYLLPK